MSDLDDKLREIVNKLTSQLSGKYHKEVADLAIAQIKQAFAEAGYKQIRTEPINIVIDNEPKPGDFMTGQEWYDRFEKELDKVTPDVGIDTATGSILYVKQKPILEAAKRAAGIE